MQLLFRPVMSLIQSHQSWLYNPLVTHSHLSKVFVLEEAIYEFFGLQIEIVMNELRRFKHSADFLANNSHIIGSAATSAS